MQALMPRNSFRIGPWLVETDQNNLIADTKVRHLLPRSMQLLVYLAEHHNIVVESEELIAALWGKRFVGENPLYKHIALLRQSLKLSGRDAQYIQTIPKKGYRLVAEVIFPDDYQRPSFHQVANWVHGSPYRGLHEFEFAHAQVFFGRDRTTKRVAESLQSNANSGTAFILLLGASGSGKSSLIRAGVIPYLCTAPCVPNVKKWYRAYFKPSDSPDNLLNGLVQALVSCGFSFEKNDDFVIKLAKLFVTAPQRVGDRLSQYFAATDLASSKIVLFVDQLEEIFALNEITHVQRETFIEALHTLATLDFVWVIAAMRNDYYPRCAELDSLVAIKEGSGQIDVDTPTPVEISQMIRLPARAANLKFEEDSTTNLRLDDMLRDAAVDNPASLPLLEFALDALYEKKSGEGLLTLSAYKELGGLTGALARRAETTYAGLSAQAQASVPRIFNALVEIDASSGQRTNIPLVWDSEKGPMGEVVRQYVASRLFISELDEKGLRIVSIVHEALIQHWPRLRVWLDENDELLRIRNRLRNSATRWNDETRRRDLLLPAGRRVQEAMALEEADHIELSPLMSEFLQCSKVRDSHNRWLSVGAVAVLVAASVATGIAGVLATTARYDAQQRQTQAEDLLGFMVGELRERLVPLGRLDILDTVGSKALTYFASQDVDTLSEAALVNHAKTLEQIGQVRLAEGSMAGALEAFTDALRMSDEISQRDNSNYDALFALGNAHYWVGFVNWKLGNLDITDEHWQAYFQVAKTLTVVDSTVAAWQLELSYAYNNLGTLAQQSGNSDRAVEMFSKSILTKEQLLNADPANSAMQVELADSLSWLGSTLESQGLLGDAQEYFTRMLSVVELAANANPSNAQHQHRLGIAHQHVARLYAAHGEPEKALSHYHRAEQITDWLLSVDRANSTWQRDRAYLDMKRGQVLTANNNFVDAQKFFLRATNGFEYLTTMDSANREWRRLRAINEISYAHMMFTSGRISESEVLVKNAIKELSTDGQRNLKSNRERRWLVRGYLLARRIELKNTGHNASNSLLIAAHELEKYLPKPLRDPLDIAVAQEIAVASGDMDRAQSLARIRYAMGYRDSVLY